MPYDYTALEPYIDAQTMNIHHKMHHNAYVTKLNAALNDATKKDVTGLQEGILSIGTPVRNNGGGHYNHSLFWKWMSPVGSANSAPHGELKQMIEKTWGSVDEMKKVFNDSAANRFGSGWAWLGVKNDGQLGIVSTANQDNPLMTGASEVKMIPILGLEVWEHAYYLKYQNRRPEYISQWWNVVNWDTVVAFYDQFAKNGLAVPATELCQPAKIF
jgi:Fe-Mn family superoxide dismutase